MQQIVGIITLWTAIAAEIAIFTFVTFYTIKHCVPWDDIREKKLIRARLAARVPLHRERLRRLLAKAGHSVRRGRSQWARSLADDITKDSVRLLDACGGSVDSIERHLWHWPREAEQIDQDVTATIDCVERMLDLRDERIPEIVRFRAEVAREIVADLSMIRDAIAARIEECAREGCSVSYERRCISLLSNAFAAYAAAAAEDPEEVFSRAARWRDRMRDIAFSVELRSAVARRIAAADEAVPRRIARIRQLLIQARPLLAHLAKAKPGSLIERLAAITVAEAGIDNAEKHLRSAWAFASEEGTDVGADGASARRLKEALLMAERADQFLATFEEDLLVAAAAFDARDGADPKQGN
ncbi:MAG: hypothetical protein RL272_1236 [Candidatus Parcubacteria bacterium]